MLHFFFFHDHTLTPIFLHLFSVYLQQELFAYSTLCLSIQLKPKESQQAQLNTTHGKHSKTSKTKSRTYFECLNCYMFQSCVGWMREMYPITQWEVGGFCFCQKFPKSSTDCTLFVPSNLFRVYTTQSNIQCMIHRTNQVKGYCIKPGHISTRQTTF